jgi:hypothetical protein
VKEGSSGGECKSQKPTLVHYDEIHRSYSQNFIKNKSSSSRSQTQNNNLFRSSEENPAINRESMVFRSREQKVSIDGGSS